MLPRGQNAVDRIRGHLCATQDQSSAPSDLLVKKLKRKMKIMDKIAATLSRRPTSVEGSTVLLMRDWVACWRLTLTKAFVAGGCLLAIAALAPTESRAQSNSGAAATPPVFAVATIKPSKPGDTGSSLLRDASSRFIAENATLRMLITYAYNIQNHQLLGGPGWANSEAFDVVGKPDGHPGLDEFRQMIQSLLADRFQLKLHRDTRDLPIYGLVVGKNGPKLSRWEDSPGPMVKAQRGKLTCQKVSTAILAKALTRRLDRTVADQTGLTGDYDFTLEWTPDETQGPRPTEIDDRQPGTTSELGPSIFTAIQEQLGLKLVAGTGPVEVLIIESAERPSAN